MGKYFMVVIAMVFVQNYVLAQILGLCPFINVSRRTDSALGMGLAVTFVMAMTSAVTWPLYFYVLNLSERNIFVQLGWMSPDSGSGQPLVAVLKVATYILVIAGLVQFIEMYLKKSVPALYRSLGIFLPLITTNCTILGVALLNTTNYPGPGELSFLGAVWQGLWAGLGFTLVMLLMSGVRERLDASNVPESMKDIPIAFVCTGLMAVAFMGFAGIVK